MISKPVVIITGVSSGIGLATAQFFNEQGWVVVGTVRDRARLPEELTNLALDLQVAEMTHPEEIAALVKTTHKTYGRIDAVVANAGYGLVGNLEKLTAKQITDQLAVNVVAVAELTRCVIPIMRKVGKGTIVATSSIAGRMGLPGYSAYSASKFALEGLFESLWYEVEGTGIKLRLIEPSSVKTAFWTTGLVQGTDTRPRRLANRFLRRTIELGTSRGLLPIDVARRIYRAVISTSDRLHYTIGNTGPMAFLRRILPDWAFRHIAHWYFD